MNDKYICIYIYDMMYIYIYVLYIYMCMYDIYIYMMFIHIYKLITHTGTVTPWPMSKLEVILRHNHIQQLFLFTHPVLGVSHGDQAVYDTFSIHRHILCCTGYVDLHRHIHSFDRCIDNCACMYIYIYVYVYIYIYVCICIYTFHGYQ